MDFIAIFILVLFCGAGLWYAKKRIDSITIEDDSPLKIYVSYTASVMFTAPHRDKTPWNVTVYVYTDGTLKFVGNGAKEYFEGKSAEFQKYIFPLTQGASIPRADMSLAKLKGIQFYD